MEEEIQDYLDDHYILKIKVNFLEFRKYEIEMEFEKLICKINFTYDNHYTFESNMISLSKCIEDCILKYYRKENWK